MCNAFELSCSHTDNPFAERSVPLAIIRHTPRIYTTLIAAFSDVFTNRWNRIHSCSVTTEQLHRAKSIPRK